MHKESKVIMKGGAINTQNELRKKTERLRKGYLLAFSFSTLTIKGMIKMILKKDLGEKFVGRKCEGFYWLL